MFFAVFSKSQVLDQGLFERTRLILDKFAEGLSISSQLKSIEVESKYFLHFIGSERVNHLVQSQNGSWLYCIGNPWQADLPTTGEPAVIQGQWLEKILRTGDNLSFLENKLGNFVFVLYDAIRDRISILPDLNGLGQCYYLETKDYIAFSNFSTPLGILAGKGIDAVGAYGLFYNSYLPGNRTLYEDVFCLRNLYGVEIDQQGFRIIPLTTPFERIVPQFSNVENLAKDIYDIYVSLLRQKREAGIDHSPHFLGLTGGRDSRLVAALARAANYDMKCFFSYTTTEENRIATRVAQALGFDFSNLDMPSFSITEFVDAIILRSKVFDGENPGPFGLLDFVERLKNGSFWNGFGSECALKSYWKISKDRSNSVTNAGIVEQISHQMRSVNYNPRLFNNALGRDIGFEYTLNLFEQDVINIGPLHPTTIVNYLYLRHRLPKFCGRYTNGCQELMLCEVPLANFSVMSLTLQSPVCVFEHDNLIKLITQIASPGLQQIPYSDGTTAYPITTSWQKGKYQLRRGFNKGIRILSSFAGIDLEAKKKERYLQWLAAVDFSPKIKWRDILMNSKAKQFLDPAAMLTLDLYNVDEYQRLLDQSLDSVFSAHNPLAIVLQIEIAAQRLRGMV